MEGEGRGGEGRRGVVYIAIFIIYIDEAASL